MGFLDKLKPSHSISARLTWRITGTVFIIMTVTYAFLLAILWFVGYAFFTMSFQFYLDISEAKFNRPISNIENTIRNYVPEIEERQQAPDELFSVVERIVELNPEIEGASVAFTPDYFPQKGKFFAPCAYRDNTGNIVRKQLASEQFDYTQQVWYQKAIETDNGNWSEPYINKQASNIPVTTFSIALKDQQGKKYAVVTADLELEYLSQLLQRSDSILTEYFDSEEDTLQISLSFITTEKGNILAHSEKEYVMSNLSDYFNKALTQKKDTTIIKHILNGKIGNSIVSLNGKTHILSYAPIKNTNWFIGVFTPFGNIAAIINVFILVFAILLILGLLCLALVCRYAILKTTKPLKQFAQSADTIAQGQFNAVLPEVNTKDEMLTLRNSFKSMQKSLARQIEETRTVNEAKGRMESELNIARNIQMSMLPKTFPPFPDRNDIDIYAQVTPAKAVGGDLYDFFVRDEKLFFCIGDVSGKGVPASLVMAVTMALFRTLSSHEANPERIISRLNNTISEGNDSEMFVTLFLGVLDLPTGRLRYANAGHNAPLLIESEGKKVTMLDVNPNLPVGIMHDWKYIAQEKLIEPNSAIFLYTDGLTEAENINQQLFGEKRLINAIQQVESTLQPHTFIEHIFENVKQFVGEADQSDDLTMMAVRYSKEQQAFSLERSIELTNDIKQVSQLTAFVDEVCETVGVDMSTTMSLNLALEEAVVNVMNYGYPAGQVGHIEVKALANEKTLTFVISDDGIPFDPTAKSEVDTTLSVEQRPIGGLGIHLVRTIMDSINYERTRGRNILTLRKKL